MAKIIRQAQKRRNMYPSRNTEASKPEQSDDVSLIEGYYEFLHPRRTLDQFYYHMLENTETRDESQVIQRWVGGKYQKVPSETYVLMADQLWLWIVNDSESNDFHIAFIELTGISDTVVTSFAEPWGESRESNHFDVLRRFTEYINSKDRSPVKSAHDLVTKIVRHCLNAYNWCNPPGVDFQNIFEEAINSAVSDPPLLYLISC
jgi:hypothetical protein